MSWLQPQWAQFVSFTAALRKPLLVPSGYFSPNQETFWIWGIPGPNGTPISLIGTIDGVNAVFTSPLAITSGISVFRNGVLQLLGTMYTVSGGNTITFLSGFIPQPGDYLQAIVGNIGGLGPSPNISSVISVGASPFIYTAGQFQEAVYISGGVVTNITKNSVQLTQALPCTVVLQPGENITVTYSSAPLMVKTS